jgi:hypothetical protein
MRTVAVAAVLCALAVGCAGDQPDPGVPAGSEPADLIANGEGYSFRRLTPKATELVIEQGFGEAALDEVVSVFARKGEEPVGPIDVMVLNEPVTPQDWVDEFYADLMQQDVSDDVGSQAIVFTGSAIGVVMQCRTEPDHILIRGAGTHRDPLVELMRVLAERCA